ncbi:MAG: chemotaxis protein CheA, partial [Rhodocyclaceae bacterium]|nr:chemotaxis protein CheA [Rhodocyclaceae bacterium]
MTIDMSQFYQVFFEETEEHLDSMESLLLGLDVGAPDPEQLNAVFRAAHSIKGSSGTFGFTDLAEVTHILENLLDRIRKGEQALRDEMIDAFLDAGDVLKSLLAAHKGEGAADPAAVEAICRRLRDLTTSGAPAPGPVQVAVVPEASQSTPGLAAAGEAGWHLCFQIDGDNDYVAGAAQNLLDELVTLAPGLSAVTTAAGGEGCPWEVDLRGQVDADAVRSVLDFIARSDSIRISALGVAAAANPDDGAYGFFEATSEGEATTDTVASGDDSFGFFDPLPEVPAGDAAVRDEAYGFFEALAPQETGTEAAPDAANSSGDAANSSGDAEAYG